MFTKLCVLENKSIDCACVMSCWEQMGVLIFKLLKSLCADQDASEYMPFVGCTGNTKVLLAKDRKEFNITFKISPW